ncbi:MAG: hypothetical protein HY931_03165 [Candidatus Falkowbacteria bacterium]|nr:MAG: hypothetical protein HY931_03165 [Candidatus Falkowbacteria bacterium]
MKKIFLFLANEVMQILEMAAVLCVLSYIVVIIFVSGFSPKILASLWPAWLILVVLGGIIFVVHNKITSFSIDDNRMAVIIYYPNGKFEYYKKPLWGKFNYKTIYFPTDWGKKKVLSHDFRVSLTLEALGREVIIPFNLKLEMGDYFDAATLHKLILWQKAKPKRRTFKLNECVQNVFTEFNLNDEERKLKLEDLAKQLFSSIADKKAILELIQTEVEFPYPLFKANAYISLLRGDIRIKLFDQEQFLHI